MLVNLFVCLLMYEYGQAKKAQIRPDSGPDLIDFWSGSARILVQI